VLDSGETFGKNFFIFRSEYFENKNANAPSHVKWPDWRPRPGTLEKLNRVVSEKTSRVIKSECLDLPPYLKEYRYVEMGPDQAKAYKEMKNDFITFIKEAKDSENPKAVIAEHAATKMLRLQEIVSGYVKTEDDLKIQLTPNPRLTELETLLEDLTPNHKVVVWACFIENYDMIKKVCHKLKVKYAELHGGIAQKQPQIDSFRNDPLVRVCIANPAAAGIGINLTEASYCIYFSKSFNLEHNYQSQDRIYRGGSEIHEKITRIDLIAKGTSDELVDLALKNKQTLADIILETKLDKLQAMI
jgi:SNF2 family DNA or RNA helicase